MALNGASGGMDLEHVSSSSLCSGDTELAEHNASNSGRFKEWIGKSKKMLVVASLWIAYLLSSTAISVMTPFFPQIVSSSSIGLLWP